MRPFFRVVCQLLLGAAPFVIAVVLLRGWARIEQRKNVPSGWMIIRPPEEVACLLPDGDRLWAGGRDGLHWIECATGKLLSLPNGEPRLGYVHALLKSRAGAVWIAHDDGIAVYDNGQWAAYGDNKNGVPFRRAFSLVEDPDGRILIGTEAGLASWQNGRWEGVSPPMDGSLGEINVLYFDRSGRLWAGSSSPTRGGLRMLDDGRWRVLDAAQGLPHPAVNAVLQDRGGAVWVATGFGSQGGTARMMPGNNQLTPVAMEDAWAGVKARSLYEDTRGRMWVGLEYDGVLIFEGASWSRIAPGKGLAGQEVKGVRQDATGVYWLGTNDGLSRFDPSVAAPEDPPPQPP